MGPEPEPFQLREFILYRRLNSGCFMWTGHLLGLLHFLDHHGIGEPGVFASLTPGKLDKWWEAASNRDAIIELARLSTLKHSLKRSGMSQSTPTQVKYDEGEARFILALERGELPFEDGDIKIVY